MNVISKLKKFFPYIVAIILFYLVTTLYFLPLIQGKSLNQSDVLHYRGGSKEISDFRSETGEEALWTNSMFGGMPAFQISVAYKSTILTSLQKVLRLGLPGVASIVFLYFLGFFALLLVFKINPWLAIVGALAFGFSSYFFIIIEAGHNTKALAIAYMAPLLAGIVLAYREKWLLGFIITALFTGLEISANHFQITYYLLLIIIILVVFEFVDTIRSKTYTRFIKSSSILLVAGILGVMLNLPALWSTYDYGKQTIRGKSELKAKDGKVSSGIDKDYATQWSYGIQETLSLIIPNVKGGATNNLSANSEALQKVEPKWRQNVGGQNHYWGDQPFTSGPVYVGAFILFAFIFGLFILKGKYKWMLLTATIISILLAWGKNFMPLTDFFLDYVPLYNKFRAVTMTLVIAELAIPLLAIITLNKIIETPDLIKLNKKKLWIAFGVTGGLLAILYLFPQSLLGFISNAENAQFARLSQSTDANTIKQFMLNLETARIHIFRVDVLRSILFITLAFVSFILYGNKKIGSALLIGIWGIIVMLDMIPIVHRYLNEDDYVRSSTFQNAIKPTVANSEILKDNSIYRVANFSVETFMDANTSYFHQSIGGYTAAKLRRYQDLVERQIIPEKSLLTNALANFSSMEELGNTYVKLTALNMLNTKYFIYNPNSAPLLNSYALGNAWFVKNYYTVNNADEEILSLKKINPANEAVFDIKFKALVEGKKLIFDPNAKIDLVSYQPNHLIYNSESSTDQFSVFSEIYYDKGWNVYLDGKEYDYFRANYLLRAMIVPAGKHKIEFRFEPKSYIIGTIVSSATSVLIILLIVVLILWKLKIINLLSNAWKKRK